MGRPINTVVRAQMAATGVQRRQAQNQLKKAAQASGRLLKEVAGSGLDCEILRLESLAATLGEGAKDATGPERSALIGDYTRVVEALRRMKSDRPDIDQAEGKMIPVDEADKVLAQRDNALIPLLKGMAKRLAPICANRPAADVETEVENEVGQIMRQVEAAM